MKYTYIHSFLIIAQSIDTVIEIPFHTMLFRIRILVRDAACTHNIKRHAQQHIQNPINLFVQGCWRVSLIEDNCEMPKAETLSIGAIDLVLLRILPIDVEDCASLQHHYYE